MSLQVKSSTSTPNAYYRTIFFCGYFDTPASGYKVFSGNGTDLTEYGSFSSADGTDRVGAVFSFAETNVTSRVGVSFISSSKACQFANDEIPSGTPLQSLVSDAQAVWNTDVFSKIQTTEVCVTLIIKVVTEGASSSSGCLASVSRNVTWWGRILR